VQGNFTADSNLIRAGGTTLRILPASPSKNPLAKITPQ